MCSKQSFTAIFISVHDDPDSLAFFNDVKIHQPRLNTSPGCGLSQADIDESMRQKHEPKAPFDPGPLHIECKMTLMVVQSFRPADDPVSGTLSLQCSSTMSRQRCCCYHVRGRVSGGFSTFATACPERRASLCLLFRASNVQHVACWPGTSGRTAILQGGRTDT